MLILTNAQAMARALASPIAPDLKRVLRLRRDQLLFDTAGAYDLGELAHFIIVSKGDTLPEIETAVNYPIMPDPPWEWVLDHGKLFEAPIIVSDDGCGIVLIVPDLEGVDATLLGLVRRDSVPASTFADDSFNAG
ncbi:hypothetical protein [Sphingomonas sp. G-3-2-10]|uniref:hypothetical protein n=1 Tax=Sphingomonas sp. G-3-2-10 TaxID=2728838 RepID=UPI001469C22E|nr:hypothetical protein [Sphingomonas sp. G-3-2-10]NML06529.1 hypothetical protein [Sphingomonas sp. G-3-2-10]